MSKLSLFFVPLFLILPEVSGQIPDRPLKDSMAMKIIEQIILFPQEKIHLHTDREVYLSGETIWFRAWLTDAVLHRPVVYQYITAELISPAGDVVSRARIRAFNDAFQGYIKLDQALPGGDYTLTAYSERMLETGPDYFFRKKIRIEGPMSATVTTGVRYRFDGEDRITAEVDFMTVSNGSKLIPEKIRIGLNGQVRDADRMDADTVTRFSFRLPAGSRQRTLTVETGRSSEVFTVPYPQDDFDVGFYPEGGYIAEGAATLVAFRALASDGSPVVIKGRITDSEGNEYAQIETFHDGMGSFYIRPETGVELHAVCTDSHGKEKIFSLPEVKHEASLLWARVRADSLYIGVTCSPSANADRRLFLVLHTRGMPHYMEMWDHASGSLAFDTHSFPSGVMQALLLDGELNPLSERLVFIRNDDQARAILSTDLEEYARRQQVNARLSITGPDGLPRTGAFSVSVTDDAEIEPDTSVSILTDLLLTSDIRGYVRDPSFYFTTGNPKAARALDLLMLTNGWRRYNIPEVMKGNLTAPVMNPKTGMEISGSVRSLILGKPVARAQVAVFSYPTGYYQETEADSEGRFAFGNIEFPDSTEFLLQALNRSGTDRVEIVPDREFFPGISPLPPAGEALTLHQDGSAKMGEYITRADTKYTMENGMRTVYIEEVVITARAPEKKETGYSFYMPKSENDFLSAEEIEEIQPAFLSDVLRYLPHIEIVADSNGQKKAVIQRMSYALTGSQVHYAALIVDDMIIHDYDLDMFNPMDIERIGVLRGTKAIMMGSDATGGAIVITTRKGSSASPDLPKNNIAIVRPAGYQAPAEFYSPRYETEESRKGGPPDLRTTIYWNPDIAVNSDGSAGFDFFTADPAASYRVLIEGVTSDGLIILGRGRVKVR
jgi:hypothetical protein